MSVPEDDLMLRMRKAVAAYDGDRNAMYEAGRKVLIDAEPHPDMLACVRELALIVGLPVGKLGGEPWKITEGREQ